MATDHSADYLICIRSLPVVIAHPTYIGQAPQHGENFEILGRVGLEDGRLVLVAVGLEPDHRGDYRVKSCYLVTPDQVETRRQAGRLKLVLPPS